MSTNRPKLNDKKASFLSGTPLESHQLSANELPSLVNFYNSKINRNKTNAAEPNKIEILINGGTKSSKKIIETKQNAIKKQIAELQDDNLKYALYFKEQWNDNYEDDSRYAISPTNFRGNHKEIKNLISPFLGNYNIMKSNLSSSEMKKLNTLIKNSQWKDIIDNKINEYIKDKLQKDIADCCINRKEMKAEVLEIQKSLKPGEMRGYIYTNNHMVEKAHFEVLIITKDSIIKPVDWNLNNYQIEIESHTIPNLTATICNPPVVELIQTDGSKPSSQQVFQERLKAQAGTKECGTLGIMYLKELLKNGATQLNQLTMQFAIPAHEYSVSGEKIGDPILKNFFFPSPQVLAYSQSSFYNKIILAMLNDAESVNLTNVNKSEKKEKIYQVKTLKTLLTESIQFLKDQNPKKNADTIKTYQSMLDNLPNFRTQWLKEYANAEIKRAQMQQEVNLYLNYKTHKKERIDELSSGTATIMQSISTPPQLPRQPPEVLTAAKATPEVTSREQRSVVPNKEIKQSSFAGTHRAAKASAAGFFNKENTPSENVVDTKEVKKPKRP